MKAYTLLIIMALFMSFGFTTNTSSETTTDNIEYLHEGDAKVIEHQKWYCEDQGKWGSFWWGVERTEYPDAKGWYTYYVYFYSNSYFNTDLDSDGDYDKAITYILNTNLVMDEYHKGEIFKVVELEQAYILCDWKKVQGAYFYSKSPSNIINLEYESASPYNYTKNTKK